MGVGIALAFAAGGIATDLIDLKERTDPMAALERAQGSFEEQLELLVLLSVVDAADRDAIRSRLRLHPAGAQAGNALVGADMVIEAVPETMDAKRQACARICASIAPETLIVSTTSTFLADAVAELVERPEHFLNTHWLNPAYLIPLVEVSPCSRTSPEAVAEVLGVLRAVGKLPVTVRASPGFIVPRLQALVMNEAVRLWEEGVATADDIDTATRFGFGLRFAALGVLEFIDWGGADTLLHASRYLRDELAADRFDPPEVLVEHVERGDTGMHAGRGVRDFSTIDRAAFQRERTGELVALLRLLDLLPKTAGRRASPP